MKNSYYPDELKLESASRYSPKNISEAIFYLIEFKQKIKKAKKGKFNGFLIISDLFKNLKEKLNKDYDQYDLKKIDKYYFSQKLKNMKQFKIKIIESLSCMKSFEFEIVDKKVIEKIFDPQEYNNKEIIYNKISETEQQITFKDNSIIKISNENGEEKIRVFEPPIIQGKEEENNYIKKIDIKQSKNINDSYSENNSIKVPQIIGKFPNQNDNENWSSIRNQKQYSLVENGSYVYNRNGTKVGLITESNNNSNIKNNMFPSGQNSLVAPEKNNIFDQMNRLYI